MDKAEYLQMFEDCGWEYIQDYAQYSYFRKPASAMQGTEEIFCDDDSRAQMLLRIFKHRYLPFAALVLLNLLILLMNGDIYDSYIITALYCGIIVLYIAVLITFVVRYRKFKNRR